MSAIAETDPSVVFVPLAVATVPPSGFLQHYKDYWWVVHPDKGIVFWKSRGSLSAQCNSNREITAHLRDKMYPWADIRQIPSVFRRIDPADYA